MYQMENFLIHIILSILISFQEFICSYGAKNDEKLKLLV